MNQKRKKQILGILLLAFTLMFAISLAGHTPQDDLQITSDEAVYGNPFKIAYQNLGGMMGAYVSYVMFFFFGWGTWLIVPYLIALSLRIIGIDLGRRLLKHTAIWWGLTAQFLLLLDIARVKAGDHIDAGVPDGAGALGQTLLEIMLKIIGQPGAYILFLATIICTIVYYAAISARFHKALLLVGNKIKDNFAGIMRRIKDEWEKYTKSLKTGRPVIKKNKFKNELKKAVRRRDDTSDFSSDEYSNDVDAIELQESTAPSIIEDKIKAKQKVTLSGGEEKRFPTPVMKEGEDNPQKFIRPGMDLLANRGPQKAAYDEKEINETATSLRETLETFGVNLAGNIEMYPGPIITRFEVKPGMGVKVNQIANLSDDLALNLRAKSIRIVAPIPGKAAVGIEIPNRSPQIVYLRDTLMSEEFQRTRFQLPMALGLDISGNPYVTDLAAMPHLLIAGTTGSGKSVCINVMITSLIYALHPSQLRFIFIDPKMLELTIYKGIPYLEEKVVTNPKQAERVLNDIVTEMESRYRLLAKSAVRNIVDYNNKQQGDDRKLPYIVIVIDELADLMMSSQSSRLELLITRLAQMARAVGIHLILATQRPSVDVITGLIKANFPSRIAFQVATKTDSRTILDCNGAEKLLGHGDMLFLQVGFPEPMRLHGAYISSGETEKLVGFLSEQAYSQQKIEEFESVAEEKAQMSQFNDPVLMEAIETVVRQGQASVSMLQRKLGIGYQRAARLIDELEEMKVVGEYQESKAREVLVGQDFLNSIKRGR